VSTVDVLNLNLYVNYLDAVFKETSLLIIPRSMITALNTNYLFI